MPSQPTFEPAPLFACLERHQVDYIVIGGLAGFAHGAGWPTYDADIVVERSPQNLSRLLVVLRDVDAIYDTFHQPPLRPDERLLALGSGPQLFRTKYGRLDVLKEAGGETYDSLLSDAVASQLYGVVVRCAGLEALLRMKRAANRPKDQPAIAKIEAKLREREQSPE